jgi:hypothetical protein
VKKPEQQVIAVKTAQPLIGNIVSNAPRTQIGFQINVKNFSPDIKPTSNLQVISQEPNATNTTQKDRKINLNVIT